MTYSGTVIEDLDALVDHVFGQVRTPVLGNCEWIDQGGYEACRNRGTVLRLEDEREYCITHFHRVEAER